MSGWGRRESRRENMNLIGAPKREERRWGGGRLFQMSQAAHTKE